MAFNKLKQWAKRIKTDTLALYFAVRHPGTPWYAKLLAGMVAAYAFSPIDLIPDFIPVLGYIDDLVILPLGIALAIVLIPEPVMLECRERARQITLDKPVSRMAGAVIILIWASLAAGLILRCW